MGFHNRNGSDGVPQRGVNSPRYSSSMTRRAPSFKRNNANASASASIATNSAVPAVTAAVNNGGNALSTHHEIDLLTSPRSDSAASLVSGDGFDALIEKKQTQNHFGFLIHRVTVNKKLLNGGSATVGAVVELGLRERRKLGQWMFFFFCGVCLLLAVFKIFFGGLIGSTIDSSHQDVLKSSCM